MAARGRRRLIVACAGVGIAVVTARRIGGTPASDPAREVYLETRRERMRAARRELLVVVPGEVAC
jgi:hypothetical protein